MHRQWQRVMCGTASMALAVLVGCTSSASTEKGSTSTQASTTQPTTYPPAPAGSPFAKVQVGMDQKQVFDLIGPPTDTTSYTTGKAWIPFYYGGDTYRTQAKYKGIGRIIFSQSSRFSSQVQVSDIQYDPSETGYN